MPLMLGVRTNGKTSTVHRRDPPGARLHDLLSSSARRIVGDEEVTSSSPPRGQRLHAILARGRETGVQVMCLEVSVQAIIHGRSTGIVFDVAGFTNLQLDHREDFADMDDYLQAKARMFKGGQARKAVVSLDTVAGRAVAAEAECP